MLLMIFVILMHEIVQLFWSMFLCWKVSKGEKKFLFAADLPP